jgi:general secretion pathway protein G
MHKAFTMIELIFVIVIIGILSAVAIPKLTATRDDAKSSALAANIRLCIADAAAEYQAKNVLTDLTELFSCSQANGTENDVVSLIGDSVIVNSSDTIVNTIVANGTYPVKGYQVTRD